MIRFSFIDFLLLSVDLDNIA